MSSISFEVQSWLVIVLFIVITVVTVPIGLTRIKKEQEHIRKIREE